MTQPVMLDTFCKAGGTTKGYQRAGFYVIGVDIEPQPRYCGDEFIQDDAMEVLEDLARGYGFGPHNTQPDAVHASPPCHDHSALNIVNKIDYGTGWMLDATRRLLKQAGLPYVIENVGMADMPGALVLCGTEFGLKTRTAKHGEVWLKRHRKFESNIFLMGAGGCNCYGKLTVPVYGHGAGGNRVNMRGPGVAQAGREVMGIDWMTRDELDQAIPPAYTEYIGQQLLDHLAVTA